MAGRRRLDGETVPQPDDVSMNASPKIKQTKLEKIRPTQMSVGFVEVAKNRRAWAQVAKGDRIAFLLDHAFPAVLGPGDRYFATDHHHLGRALLDEKVDSVFVSEARDFSALVLDEFWVVMDHLQWAHPYDALGVRQPFDAMPRKLSKLADDPYRGLAAQVRDAGGYAKDTAAFAEFLWADFLRRRVPAQVLTESPKSALARALDLSHGPQAEHLPGWSGTAPH